MSQTFSEQLFATGIDAIGFGLGNYIAHSAIDQLPAPKMRHVLIFSLVDFAIRNNYLRIKDVEDSIKGSKIETSNIYIGVIYAAIASLYDGVIRDGSIGKTIINNAIRGAIGAGSNIIIDNTILNGNQYQKYM